MSELGLKLLTEREGRRCAVYLDTRGIPTVGVGHTGPDVKMGDVWTDEQVAAALCADLERFEAAINGAIHVPLEQHEFDALVSFAFNVGVTAAARSTLVRRINDGDREGAAAQFDRWHMPPEIIPRRTAEREQFRGTRFAARMDNPIEEEVTA
jgi:lysozyme